MLYGFLSTSERNLFRLLVNYVTGIGPKIALDILGNLSVDNFMAAVVKGDSAFLANTKGIKLSAEIKGPKVLVLLWREGVRRYVVVDESK